MDLTTLPIRIYADGADLASIIKLADDPAIAGITTNPTLMRIAGVTDYAQFAGAVLEVIEEKPVSFEVLADDLEEINRQAKVIASWGRNVYVKIPVSTSSGESTMPLVRELSGVGVKVNVTAITTRNQMLSVAASLSYRTPAIVSVFCGRISDAGHDAIALIRSCMEQFEDTPNHQILWASTRQVYNIFDAISAGCSIITMPNNLLAKARTTLWADLGEVSLKTIRMFADDAKAAGYSI